MSSHWIALAGSFSPAWEAMAFASGQSARLGGLESGAVYRQIGFAEDIRGRETRPSPA